MVQAGGCPNAAHTASRMLLGGFGFSPAGWVQQPYVAFCWGSIMHHCTPPSPSATWTMSVAWPVLPPSPFHVNDVLKVLATVCAAPEAGGQRQ